MVLALLMQLVLQPPAHRLYHESNLLCLFLYFDLHITDAKPSAFYSASWCDILCLFWCAGTNPTSDIG